MIRSSLGVLTLAFLLFAAPIAGQASDDERLIREARARSNAAIANQDVEGILAEVDPEFHVTAGSGAFIPGRAEMGEAFQRQFAEYEDLLYVRMAEQVQVDESGLRAFERGSWVGTWSSDTGTARMRGRYAAAWTKVSGDWRIRSELFVTLGCEGGGCD